MIKFLYIKLVRNYRLFFLFLILAIFLLLLAKNPFSERNLISNLEPFPDTIHYLNPPKSFLQGKGFLIEREGGGLNTAVPPLYSLVLLPVFIINQDARMFYFVNIFLALISLILFYKVLEILIKNFWINLVILFFYISNYFVYWYPTLAMAENLILTLFMLSLYLLVRKSSWITIIGAGFIGIAFYAIKYASITLSLSFLLLFLVKIFLEFRKKSPKNIILYSASIAIAFLIFASFEYLVKEKNTFASLVILISWLFPAEGTQVSDAISPRQNTWFSFNYFNKNIYLYLNALIGKPLRFLWDSTPLVPNYVGIIGIIGLIIGLINKKTAVISSYLILSVLSTIFFLSTFYTSDARYIYHAIPVLLIGFGIFLKFLHKILLKNKLLPILLNKKEIIFYFFLVLIFIFYLSQKGILLKSQIMLNLKYAETPWYYIGVKETNSFFNTLPIADKKPILLSALPPYYIDFFSNGSYKLLPLSKDQEFRQFKEVTWGPNDYSNLIKLYKKYLNSGYDLYISNSGLGNEGYLHAGFNEVKENFKITQVNSACYNTCNIYKVELINNEVGE